MTIPIKKFREILFQIFYSFDISETLTEETVQLLMKEVHASKKDVEEARAQAQLLIQHLPEIDDKIRRMSHSYDFDRIQSVERNVLRLGVYELLFCEEVPPKVAIAEAMRLCRKFASPEGAAFVNAILDGIYQESLGEAPSQAAIEASAARLEQAEEDARIAGSCDEQQEK